jgi:hypothetical protein
MVEQVLAMTFAARCQPVAKCSQEAHVGSV